MKNIIWIDKNINNKENILTLDRFKEELVDYKFYTSNSVSKAFSLISNNKKEFYFNLFYVIVSGNLAENFFNIYVKKSLEIPIIVATIVYCYKQKYHESKPYYLDPFLNPGKIVSTYPEVIEYIKTDECNWKNNMGIQSLNYDLGNEGYGDIFFLVNKFSDIAYPIYLGQILNASLIKNDDLLNLQNNFLMKYYQKFKNLIKPSQEKNIEIPLHILAKFYINLYSRENPSFYSKMNQDLSNNKFDIYKTYICILYNALNKKTIKNYYSKKLYRGGIIGINEYKNLEKIWNNLKEKNSSSEIKIAVYFSKIFLSFSKSEEIAESFIIPCDDNCVPIKFILNSNSDEDFFVSNLDCETLSDSPDEKEVLILPFSCFEIINIRNIEINGIKTKEITLNYLDKYKKQIDEYINKLDNKEKFIEFFNDILNSSFAKEIEEKLGNEVHNKLSKYLEKKSPFEINLSLHFIFQKVCPEKPIPKFDPNYKPKNPGYSNGKQLNELFKSEPISLQMVKSKSIKYEALILKYKDGKSALIRNHNTIDNQYKIIKEYNEIGNLGFSKNAFENIGKEIKIEGITTQEILQSVENIKNNQLNNPEFLPKNSIIKNSINEISNRSLLRSNYYTANMCGNVIGHFITNIDTFIESSKKEKAKTIGISSIPLVISGVSKISKSMAEKTPIIGNTILIGGLLYNSINDIKSDSLNKSETFKSITKNIIGTSFDLGINIAFMELGVKIGFSLGIVSGPGAVILGATGGLIGGIIGGLFSRILSSQLELNSDCLYYKYIPKKYRFINPNLRWKNVSNKAKSFAIEMIDENYEYKWLVLNIPCFVREIHSNNNIVILLFNIKEFLIIV